MDDEFEFRPLAQARALRLAWSGLGDDPTTCLNDMNRILDEYAPPLPAEARDGMLTLTGLCNQLMVLTKKRDWWDEWFRMQLTAVDGGAPVDPPDEEISVPEPADTFIWDDAECLADADDVLDKMLGDLETAAASGELATTGQLAGSLALNTLDVINTLGGRPEVVTSMIAQVSLLAATAIQRLAAADG